MKDSYTQIAENSFESYMHDSRIKIGKNIREIREKRGYSQDELAAIMTVSRSTISKVENGKFSISLDYLSKFSWFLEFDFSIIDKKK